MNNMTLAPHHQAVFAGNVYLHSYEINTREEFRMSSYCRELGLSRVHVVPKKLQRQVRAKSPYTLYFLDNCSREFRDLSDVAEEILKRRCVIDSMQKSRFERLPA